VLRDGLNRGESESIRDVTAGKTLIAHE
jgi:hypothetical protein